MNDCVIDTSSLQYKCRSLVKQLGTTVWILSETESKKMGTNNTLLLWGTNCYSG